MLNVLNDDAYWEFKPEQAELRNAVRAQIPGFLQSVEMLNA